MSGLFGALLLAAVAHADPLALRAPLDGVVVVGGLPQVGAGAWVSDRYGLAAGVDLPGRSADLAVGARGTLTRGPSGLGVDVGAAAGVVAPFAGLRPTLEVAPWIAAGWRRPGWHLVVDLAVPAAVALGPGDVLRLPVLIEPWTGISRGGWSVTAGAGLGEVIVPGSLPAIAMRWQVGVGWSPEAR